METILLATKVRIPPRPTHAVLRTRLTDALERAIPDYKLILISAPAGYGKTTLLTQWARSSQFAVAWLSIGPEDNDAMRFLRYLLTAWEEVQPGVKETPLGLLLGAHSTKLEDVLSAFLNVASDAPKDILFVLDDYHLIEDPVWRGNSSWRYDAILRRLQAARAKVPKMQVERFGGEVVA